MGLDSLTLAHLLGRLCTLHRDTIVHPNLRNSHNENHYAHLEDLNGRWRLDGENTAYPGGVRVLECQILSLNIIFRISERPYTTNITIKNIDKQRRKSKRICLNRSGSKDHAVTKPIKNSWASKLDSLDIFRKKNYQNRITELGDRV